MTNKLKHLLGILSLVICAYVGLLFLQEDPRTEGPFDWLVIYVALSYGLLALPIIAAFIFSIYYLYWLVRGKR